MRKPRTFPTLLAIITRVLIALALTAVTLTAQNLFCARSAQAKPPAGQRDFYEALADTLGDFEFDLKHDTVKGVDHIALRDILVSESVPRSFISNLEVLITERILRATQAKVIQCLGCRARRTAMAGDQISLISARISPKELARIAKSRGILHFMDVAFTYQPTGLLMSMNITDPKTSDIIWTRTYHSENSRAAIIRRGLDLDQLDPAVRRATEYPAMIQYRLRVDYLSEPDVGGQTGCLGFAFQMVERYDSRKKELGFEAEYLNASLLGSRTSTSLYSGVNLTLLVLHAWNLIGSTEDYNQARGSINAGLGGTYSSGFLGALLRTGFEWREARHFATSLTLGYRPSSTSFLPTSTGQPVSGFELGGGISFIY